MNRRSFLAASAGGAVAFTAGCMQRLGFETQSVWRDPPLVADRPKAVYYPAVVEGMSVYDTTTAGPYTVALAYSYPHRFWQITGSDLQKTVVEDDDSLHLMAAVWESESKTVIPIDAGLSAEVLHDGDLVTQEVIYPMLSQKMGFHYGTNAALEGNGNYTATVSIGGTDMARTGRFDGRFGEPATATFDFEFDTDAMYDIEFRRLGDKQGKHGAVAPMEMLPVGRTPAIESLPGTALGTGSSGDATVPLRAMAVEDANQEKSNGSNDSNGSNESVGQSGTRVRLAAFPRTPHNAIVLPLMGLSVAVERDGETVFSDSLARTLDPDVGYHYRSDPTTIRPADHVTLTIETPPQVARHDGYETALLEMNPIDVTVPDESTG